LNAFQIRPTVDSDRAGSAAIDARDQWIAFFGVRSSVATAVPYEPSGKIYTNPSDFRRRTLASQFYLAWSASLSWPY
jgi:hypothetical protein